MKISMEEPASQIEPEIIVRCREMDEPLRRVVAAIRLASGMLIGRQEERSYMHPEFRPSYCCFRRFISSFGRPVSQVICWTRGKSTSGLWN